MLMVQALDTQINIIIGIASAAFAFTSAQYLINHSIGYLVMTLFSAFSAIAGLIAIHPPKFLRGSQDGKKKSDLFATSIAEYPTSTEYAEELLRIVKSKRAIVEGCAVDVYNISKYYYLPKRRLFRLSRNLFLVGIVVGLISTFALI